MYMMDTNTNKNNYFDQACLTFISDKPTCSAVLSFTSCKKK